MKNAIYFWKYFEHKHPEIKNLQQIEVQIHIDTGVV